jgi:hypothetical protein
LPARSWARSFSSVLSREASGEQAILGQPLGLLLHLGHQLALDHGDAELGEVAHHGLDVAPHVADLGVLGGLDLQEGRLGQSGQPARDLGLPHPGGADHDDVLRRHLVAQRRRQHLPAPAVAQRDGDGALGRALADDIAVQLDDDLGRRQLHALHRRHSTSTEICSLV